MKKVFISTAILASLIACNSSETDTTSVDTDSTVTTTTNTTTTTTAYMAADGDVAYKGGKVMVWRNGAWAESNEDVNLDNGVVVHKNGEVTRNDDVVNLQEGEVVDKAGRFFDKAGNTIEDGWDATKRGARKAGKAIEKGANNAGNAIEEGAKDAGNAIEKGAKKVGEKTKDVFDGKRKDSTNR